MGTKVGRYQIELDLETGKLVSQFAGAQRTVANNAKKMQKTLSSIGTKMNFELLKKGFETVGKAWKFLIEGSETEQFNASIAKVKASFEAVRNEVGESITRSEAFNEALTILSEWLGKASKSADGLGTVLGDGLAYALVSLKAPMIVIRGLLAYLNGWFGILAKGISLLVSGLAKLVSYHPFLRVLAEGIKEMGGPDIIASLDGLSGAFGDISSGAFEQAAVEFENMKDAASELGDGIERINAKAGMRSSSASASSKKKGKDAAGAGAKKGAAAAKLGILGEGSKIETGQWRASEEAAAMAAMDEQLAKLKEEQEAAAEAQKEAVEASQAIAGFAVDTALDGVFQPLQDGFLDIEKILDGLKSAVLDLLKEMIKALAMKAILGVATGGTTTAGGALLGALGFAGGGPVGGNGGPRADDIPAWLSSGEYVMDAATTKRYGAGFFAALQQRKLPAFASGGLVGGGSGGRMASASNVVVNVDGRGMDPDELSRAVGRALRQAGVRGDSDLRTVLPTSPTSLLRRG